MLSLELTRQFSMMSLCLMLSFMLQRRENVNYFMIGLFLLNLSQLFMFKEGRISQ